MKKIDLGQGVGILANLGVLAGVLLLVYELNQNRQLMESQTRSDLSQQVMNMIVNTYLENPELVQRAEKGEQLSEDEYWRLTNISLVEFRYHENVFYQYRRGLYEESEYLAQRDFLRDTVYSQRYKVDVWCAVRAGFSPQFVAEIDGLLTSYQCE
jgi:hypothetical protein